MTASGTTKDKEWYNKWYRVVQQMTTNDTTSDSEWYSK